MAPSLQAFASAANNNGSFSSQTTNGWTSVVGNPIIVMHRNASAQSPSSFGDSLGNVYTQDVAFTDVYGARCFLYHAISTHAGTPVFTVNYSPNTQFFCTMVWEIANPANGVFSYITQASATNGGTVTSLTTPSFSTIAANSVIVANSNRNSGSNITAASGLLSTVDLSGNVFGQNAAHGFQTTPQTGTATASYGAGANIPALTIAVYGWLQSATRTLMGVGA